MKIEGKNYRTIWFEKSEVKIIDQTKLPHKFVIKSLKNIKDAIHNKSIDEGRLKIDKKIRRSDVIFICTPVSLIDSIANQIFPYLSDHSIVTDVGSVKNCFSTKTVKKC